MVKFSEVRRRGVRWSGVGRREEWDGRGSEVEREERDKKGRG
jgi:hypothetical protein